jgi:folate-binding protein YgfZ
VTETTAWFSLPGRTVLILTGRDRVSFLHGFCTNDIKGLGPGQSCEAFITTHQAKIVAWVQVTAREDHLRVTAEPGLGPKLVAFLNRYIVSEDVELTDESAIWTTLLVVGGQASRLAAMCALPINRLGTDWPLRHGRLGSLAGQSVWIERRAWVTPADWWLELAAAAATPVEQALTEAGWQPGSAAKYEVLRIAASIPHYGIDIDDSNLPQEVNRTDQAISFTKGCYIGQEVIARLDTYEKVKFEFCGFELEQDYNFEDKIIYKKDGTSAGELTSKTFSIKLNSPVAIGVLSKKLTPDEMNELYVKEDDKLIKIVKTKLPMISL